MTGRKHTSPPAAYRLTPAQRRHLSELADIFDRKGAAFWAPNGSAEERCAKALCRRRLLQAHHMAYSKTQYEITTAGYQAVRP